eukprot:TRINITY_DN47254_c0_g1_i1.p1 TRINITY_DN47254_c0_g1~~TRINITY_DN47254_c0_g1_i1.p1  ORF type:complete len:354 (+),score=69.55 TRINITY_DN47254_c0_g1_i1:93-1064(+)
MPGVYSPGLEVLDSRDFEIHGKLGEGSYGAVHKVRVMGRRNMWLAVKKVGMEYFDYGLPPGSLREIGSLLLCKGHPNIVSLMGVLHDDDDLMLGFELCAGGDLSDYLDTFEGAYDPTDSSTSQESCKGKLIPETTAVYLIKQISTGLGFMHSLDLIHRDMKPMNVLVSSDLQSVKICDFGMVRYTLPNRLMSREISTIYYRPPEVLLSSTCYGLPSDVWSVGCLFAEILSHGRVLFHRCTTEVALLMRIFQVFGTPTPDTWPAAQHLPDWSPAFPTFEPEHLTSLPYLSTAPQQHVDFLSMLLVLDPSRRCTMDDVLRHPFLQ